VSDPLTSAGLAAATEDALVMLATHGDSSAYGELVRRRQSSIRNLLRRLCHNRALADDIAQQAFFDGWQLIRGLKSRAAVNAWLRKLAVNRWLQHLRSAKPEAELDGDLRTEASHHRINEQLDLDAALAQLKPDVRLCVVLAYSEGLSHSEVSQTVSLPLGTVKSHIARGAARLRELLREYGERDGR
jgi:RNA polymerase sigma-70 factor (ECF subfamily)